MKGGISSVVATTLIILITIVGASIIWLSVNPLINKSTQIHENPSIYIDTSQGYTFWDEEENIICVQIGRGTDNAEFEKVQIMFDILGDSVSFYVPYNEEVELVPQTNEKKVYCFQSLKEKPSQISIAAVFEDGTVSQTLDSINSISSGSSKGTTNFYDNYISEGACSDGIDNDNDGLIDLEDIGCISSDDNTETLEEGEYMGFTFQELQEKFDNELVEKQFFNGTTAIVWNSYPYALNTYLAAFISMYEATGDTKYIDYTLDNIDIMFNQDNFTDLDNDGYKEWNYYLTQDHDNNPSTPERTSCLYTIRGMREMSHVARIIKTDTNLNSVYGERADEIIEILKHDMINNPYCSYQFEPTYTGVVPIISHSAYVLLQLYLIEGNVGYSETGDYKYLNTVEILANKINNFFEQPTDSRAIAWAGTECVDLNYTYPICYLMDDSHPCIDSIGTRWCSPWDTSHSNDFVYALIELNKQGIVFTNSDMQDIVYTLKNKMWNKELENPRFYDYIDGSLIGEGGKYTQWTMGKNLAPGWVALSYYDNEIIRLFEKAENGEEVTQNNVNNIFAYYAELAKVLKTGWESKDEDDELNYIYGTGISGNALSNHMIGKTKVDYKFIAEQTGTIEDLIVFLVFAPQCKSETTGLDPFRYDPDLYGKEFEEYDGQTICKTCYEPEQNYCYYKGNGGYLKVELQEDDGNGFASGVVLGEKLIEHPMSTNEEEREYTGHFTTRTVLILGQDNSIQIQTLPWASFAVISLDQEVNLQKGNIYHIVFSNPYPENTQNLVSLDILSTSGNTEPQPKYPNYEIALLKRNDSETPWFYWPSSVPLFNVDYSNGFSQGVGYIDVWINSAFFILHQENVTAEKFVPSKNINVKSVSVRLERLEDTDGDLTFKLEKANGELIEEGLVSSSNIPYGKSWVTYKFGSEIILEKDAEYKMIFGSPKGGYKIWAIQKGDSVGLDAGNFKEGWAILSEDNGETWKGFRGNSASYTVPDLQFYFSN